jgi:hypothetical protein
MRRSVDSHDIVGKYARHAEIVDYIDTIVAENSDIASSYVAGYTYEQRALKVITIKGATNKRKVWIGNY